MKIRNGFVSNSSSSSFCIYGTSIETNVEDVLKLVKNKMPKTFASLKKDVKEWDDGEDILAWLNNMDDENGVPEELQENIDVTEYLGDLFTEDIEVHAPYGFETIYIGKSWHNIGGSETGDQFRKDIQEKISKVLDNAVFETHIEAWRD